MKLYHVTVTYEGVYMGEQEPDADDMARWLSEEEPTTIIEELKPEQASMPGVKDERYLVYHDDEEDVSLADAKKRCAGS